MSVFDRIKTDLENLEFFSEFKFRRRDSRFINKTKEVTKIVELHHWRGEGTSCRIRPSYYVKFDVLLDWFSKYNVKSKQDQKDNPTFMFGGNDFSIDHTFEITEEEYEKGFGQLKETILKCANYIFTEYDTLEKSYNRIIVPTLNGEMELYYHGADWIFIYLTLTLIVNPSEYERLKSMLLKHIEVMMMRDEPNISMYYPRLGEILEDLESLDFSSYR